MSKVVARRDGEHTAAIVAGGWKDTKALLADIERTVREFRRGRMDCEHARILVASHRNAATVLALNLEHARLTKRLVEGSRELPSLQST